MNWLRSLEDPTDPGGQFHDRGESYRTAIFYHNEEQKDKAEASKRKIAESGEFNKPIVTERPGAIKAEANSEGESGERRVRGMPSFI